jgi:membrane-associated protease RseP (regulator of RpoE activity)
VSSFENALSQLKPNEEIVVKIREKTQNNKENKDSEKEYKLTTTKHPNNETKAYLGILISNEERKLKKDNLLNNIYYKILLWLYELFTWTGFISINIGLINLFPIFITDGAQMLRKNFQTLFKKNWEKIWKNINLLGVMVILILLFLPMIRTILNFVLGLI